MYSDHHLPEHDLPENEISDFPFKWSLVPVFNETRDFSAVIAHSLDRNSALLDPITFISASFSIRYQLLSLDFSPTSVEEDLRLGALIYVREVLQD